MDKNTITYISNPAQVSMGDQWFQLTEPDHFWFKWRFLTFKKILKLEKIDISSNLKILEIGCGNCEFLKRLEESYKANFYGTDLNDQALKLAKTTKSKLYYYNIFDDAQDLKNSFDIILVLDVIEHLNNPKEFISRLEYFSKENTVFIFNVPAQQWLFGVYDSAVGHFRRYNKRTLRLEMTNTFLNQKELHFYYWGIFLLPILILRKIIQILFPQNDNEKIINQGMKKPNPLINKTLTLFAHIETIFTHFLPLGTSLFLIVKKKN